MGVSMGGMIVQQLAIAHPERLLSMTSVMSTTGDPDVGQSTPEAQALLIGRAGRPTGRRRSPVISRASGPTAARPVYDEERLTAGAGEAYDRCFTPDGQARQIMAIIVAPSRTAGPPRRARADARAARRRGQAGRHQRRPPHRRRHPRRPLRGDGRHGPRLPAAVLGPLGPARHRPRPSRQLTSRSLKLGTGHTGLELQRGRRFRHHR